MRSMHKYWMAIAHSVSAMSTCRVNVGCVLVQNKKLIGLGYVGSASGEKHCCDVGCLMEFSPATNRESCIRTIHAEMNAILNASKRSDSNPITVYSTHKPCFTCLKLLLQFGSNVIIYDNEYDDAWQRKYVDDLVSNISIRQIDSL